MSSGDFRASYCEELHGYIMDEFHHYRETNKIEEIEIKMDGSLMSILIGKAKIRLYELRPEAKMSGFYEIKETFGCLTEKP